MPADGPRRGFLHTTVLPLVAGLSLTVLGLAWFAWDAGVEIDLRSSKTAPNQASDASEPPPDAAPSQTGATMTRAVVGAPDRNVTPEGVTSVPWKEGPYTRVAPDPRPEEPAAAPARETLYRRVIVLGPGVFRAVEDGRAVVIRIAGLEPHEFSDLCTDPDGREWKCGTRARAELARLIGGRAVSCAEPEVAGGEEVVATCRVGVYDIGRWLVENGWAEAVDPALEPLEDEARRARRGRFGPAPFGVIAG